MKNQAGFILAGCLILSALSCHRDTAAMWVVDMQCDHQDNPIAVDCSHPRLSWKLDAFDVALRDLHQSACRVLVASHPDSLKRNRGDLWDSGWIETPCGNTEYGGSLLVSAQTCYWKVRIRDQDRKMSRWSRPGHWRMGLLDSADWNGARWIALGRDSRPREHTVRSMQTQRMDAAVPVQAHASPLFRKTFRVRKPVASVFVYICGLGYSEFYLNGKRIGDRVLDPAQTSYDNRALYVTHDITEWVRTGLNTAGVMAGNGFYGQNVAFASWLQYGPPCLIAQIRIAYRDGSVETIQTDTTWKAETGPVLFDNVYAGETYDARRERPGWSDSAYDDSGWPQAVRIAGPTRNLRAMIMPPIRRIREMQPERIFPSDQGTWIMDLGQNISGWLQMRVTEPAGTIIRIRYAEHLMPDGQTLNTASTGVYATGTEQQDIYICKGGGAELWEPRFTYHGFRYAEISGLSEAPSAETVRGVLAFTDLNQTGVFYSSDSVLNRIYETSLWTLVTNLHSIPEDCPHREKCGWLGDAHATQDFLMWNLDGTLFYRKYMMDIESTLGRGGVTYLGAEPTDARVPGMVAPGKRICREATTDWGVAIVLIPWKVYLHTGDAHLIHRHYEDMKRFMSYHAGFMNRGIVKNGLGDWYPPGSEPPGGRTTMACPPDLSATILYFEALQIMQRIAAERQDRAFADWCSEMSDQVKRGVDGRYLKSAGRGNALTYGSQTANAMALRAGLVDPEKIPRVVRGLVRDIETRHGGHYATGYLGSRHLYHALCENGQDSLAYAMMTRPDFPSLAYMLGRGMTTWPEMPIDWPDDQPFGPRSFNHPMHAGFAALFHECIGGIRLDPAVPGMRHIILKPGMFRQVSRVRASRISPFGRIESRWTATPRAFRWTVRIPPNTTATVHVPAAAADSVRQNGGRLKEADLTDGYVRVDVGSGVTDFVSTW